MKTCSKCKQLRATSKFNKRKSSKDGFQSHCKLCQSKYQKTEEGKAARKRYDQTKKGKANHRKGDKKYNNTEKGKTLYRAAQKRFYVNHPNKIKAMRAVNKAIKLGKIPRPDTKLCHYCLKPAQHYHHWRGYEIEHQLDIVPVCVPCHYQRHHKHNRKIA